MTSSLKLASFLFGLAFICVGLAWRIAPAFASVRLGLPLPGGIGLGSQIADMGSCFITLGLCILIGLTRCKRDWLHAAILLLGFAFAESLIAWLLHGATFALGMMTVEALIIALLVCVTNQLAQPHYRTPPP
jgi:hypothetical protein